ncbi:MAG: hypothetical protein SFV17_26040 [Candidatus Obscuribacter sp.]|nr:hypothetical protein [Candidatus Melainabacteria bacterium]MDX1990180.1 hypothetical protein [Candidatus Obscuribacter sp.]
MSERKRNLKSLLILVLFVCSVAFANTAWGGGSGLGTKGESDEEKAFKAAMQQKALNDLLNANRTNNNNPNQ